MQLRTIFEPYIAGRDPVIYRFISEIKPRNIRYVKIIVQILLERFGGRRTVADDFSRV